MKSSHFILLLILDVVFLIVVFLLFTYYGMTHLLLFIIGLLILVTGLYDFKTGIFSELLRQLFNLPGKQKKGGIYNVIPLLMSLVVIIYSIPQLLEHGLINRDQESLMSGNYFFQFAIWLVVLSLFLLIAAIGSQFWKERNK